MLLLSNRPASLRVVALVVAMNAAALTCCEATPAPREIQEIQGFFVTEVDTLPEDRNLLADHYPASNERRIDLFKSQIANVGGGYIGVGTDQNFTFIAWAKSDYAFLIDFDYVAVDVNRIHMYLISISPTYEEFKTHWQRSKRAETAALIQQHFGAEPDYHRIRNAFRVAHRGWNDVPERLREIDLMIRRFQLSTFANNPADYNYIRDMIAQNRIQALPGDLKGSVTLQNVARASEATGIPIRILYTSNAEEYMRFPEQMRKNILALPVDEKGLVVRTMTSGAKELGFPEGEKFPEDYPFHYNVQPLDVYQAWMHKPGPFRTLDMVRHNRNIERGLSIQERTPRELGLMPDEAATTQQ